MAFLVEEITAVLLRLKPMFLWLNTEYYQTIFWTFSTSAQSDMDSAPGTGRWTFVLSHLCCLNPREVQVCGRRVTETAEVYSELTDWACQAGSEWASSGSPISRLIGCSCWPTPSRFHSPTSWPAACWETCSDRRTNSAFHKMNTNHQLTIKNPRITWQTLCPWCLSPSRTAQTAPPSARWIQQKQLLSLGQFQNATIEGFLW